MTRYGANPIYDEVLKEFKNMLAGFQIDKVFLNDCVSMFENEQIFS